MADLDLLQNMYRRVHEDWVDAGVAVDMAKERHYKLRQELSRLEREIQALSVGKDET